MKLCKTLLPVQAQALITEYIGATIFVYNRGIILAVTEKITDIYPPVLRKFSVEGRSIHRLCRAVEALGRALSTAA